ncbi:hypothetical protein [Serpentinicella alkaliphila]|uniref:DUF3592 domain-containing protein n=1 Tax=Serpentinicella alkaliphila TaxID=1734049 RepID=A0A4R2SYT2_9FIRM|nr:hypothetical protein [Serpentinicella alkaliphila]QUH26188.1 hypothetical protein HZR23_10915 [Serpentinicella alkaliphila]TCP95709.1 hypothetical protein EDD79_10575 [Serpentinicella alkaliphila]
MKKPKYKSDVYAFVFLSLGLGFIFFGCLSFINIIKPTAYSSVQDPILAGQIFCFLGTTLCVIQSGFRIFSYKQEKLHRELISKGTKTVGIIEKISLQKGITFVKKSPFIVYYTYLYKDKIYHNKSCLLWDKPNLSKGDKINIFVNDIGQSTF